MADEEGISEARRKFFLDIQDELRRLHGQPLHGLRTTLLERLRWKYPNVTFETIDEILQAVLDPCAYKSLID